MIRNRRSASSCSNYSQNSINIQAIESQSIVIKQKQKQKQKHNKSISIATIGTDLVQQQKSSLFALYGQIRVYVQPQSTLLPDKYTLNQWKNMVKQAIRTMREQQKIINSNKISIKNNIVEIEKVKNAQIMKLKNQHDHQLKMLQNQINKRMIQLNAQYSQKQQQYKQILSKFIDSLHKSQKYWCKIQSQLSTKLKNAQQLLKSKVQVQNKNQQIYQQISILNKQLTHSMNINAENINPNNMISMSSNMNMNINMNANMNMNMNIQDSLGSINLSSDQVLLHQVHLHKLQQRRNTIDISSIQEIQQRGEHDIEGQQWDFYRCLEQMICWGFFATANTNNIKKLIQITKNIQSPQLILKQPIFPIIIEAMKLQLNLNYQISEESLDNSQVMQCEGINKINVEQHPRTVMRNIQNQKY